MARLHARIESHPINRFEEGVKLIRHLVGGNSAKFNVDGLGSPTGELGISFTIIKPAPVYVLAEGPKDCNSPDAAPTA
jgi:hypothetical protein